MKTIDSFNQPEKKEGKTIEKLESYLHSFGIPTDTWGIGYAKNISDLLAELAAGESTLTEQNGELLRSTQGLAINVYCIVDGKVMRLKEDRQVFKDGRLRERSGDVMDTSLGEKLSEGEDHIAAVGRALQEELGIEEPANPTPIRGETKVKERDSRSFPGLKSKHELHYYDVLLTTKSYRPDGYEENQPEKSTYFVWEEIDELPESL